jgi:hypothetical protein
MTTASATENFVIHAWKDIPSSRRIRIREYLRRLAAELRAGKIASRQLQSAHDRKAELPNRAELEAASVRLSRAYVFYRHLHVVSSLSRGKTLDQIEKVRNSNTPALNADLLAFATSVLLGNVKLHVILHPSLTNGQKLAQTAHAVTAFMDLKTPWDNDTIIVKVASLDPAWVSKWAKDQPGYSAWKLWCETAQRNLGEYADFIDPDLPEALRPAAFAFWGPSAEQLFSILPLA